MSFESMSIRQKGLLLIEPGTRLRWVGLALLAVVVAIVEAVGALLIFLMLTLLSDDGGLSLPVVGDLSSRFPGASEQRLLFGVLVVSGVFFVLRPLVIISQVYVQSRTEQSTGAAISVRLYRGYLEMPYEFHLNRNSAELTRTSYMSVFLVVTGFLQPVTRLVSEGLVVAALLAAVAMTSPLGTALAVLVIGASTLIPLLIIQPKLRRLGALEEDGHEKALKVFNQTFDGIRDIRVLGRESFFVGVFSKQRSRLARVRYRLKAYSEIPRLAIETTVFALVIVLVAISGVGGEGGELAVLGLFGYAALRLMPSVNKIVAALNRLKSGRASVDNVVRDLQLIELESAPDDESSAEPRIRFETQIELADVSFAYEGAERTVLQDIDLVIPKGSSFGIVGPTGSGKTTLLDILLGLLEPTDGVVTVDGIDISSQMRPWRRRLGIVPQTVFLVDDTLRRNVALGIPSTDVDESALEEAVRLAQLDSFVRGLPDGLDTVVGERGVRISGGERQRIAIARALYAKPDVLVFDEATSALDTVTEAALLESIDRLSGDYTTITVAHRLATVKGADQIVLLLGGRVSDIGTYSELVHRNEVFREMAQ